MQPRTPSLPIGMNWLIERINTLGYQGYEAGICEGVSCTGMLFGLAKDLKTFDKLQELIHSIPPSDFPKFIKEINEKRLQITLSIKDKFKNLDPDLIQQKINEELKKLPADDQIALEIGPYFESIILFMQAEDHPELFPKGYSLVQDPIVSAPLVLSSRLEKQGGLIKVGSFTGTYNFDELRDYLDALAQAVSAVDPKESQPITLLLRTSRHNTLLGFDPITKEWVIIDGLVLPSLRFKNPLDLLNALKTVLTLSSDEDANATISTSFYGTKSNEGMLSAILQNWRSNEKWQKIHTVTQAKAKQHDPKNTYWLYVAAREGEVEVVRELLKNGVDPNVGTEGAATITESVRFNSAYEIAIQFGHVNIAKILMASEGFNYNVEAKQGDTLLFAAARLGHNDLVKELLAKNDPNSTKEDGATPLIIASQNGHVNVVKTLLESHVDCKLSLRDGSTALHLAAQSDHTDVVKVLIDHIGINTSRLNDGASPLYLATQKGAINSMKFLLSNNANQSLLNGSTPLDVAITMENIAAIRILLAHGAKPNIANRKNINPPLIEAILKDNIMIAKTLMENSADVNAETIDGKCALYVASQQGKVELIKELISLGADVNKADAFGNTALFIAVFQGHNEAVETILNNPSQRVDTTIHASLNINFLRSIAKERNVEDSMERLITLKNTNNSSVLNISPLELAEALNNQKIVSLLRPISIVEQSIFFTAKATENPITISKSNKP